jgi:hypothetical protein
MFPIVHRQLIGAARFAARYITGDDDIKKSCIMFAGENLLCKLFSSTEDFVHNLTDIEKMACMSVHNPLEFNARTLHSQDMERTLVEKHIRVCLSVDSRFETAVTIAPSEPVLAEASYLLMRNPAFDLPCCLLAELEHPGLDKGDRGELIVMTLCLQARDAAATRLQSRIIPVNDFIRELIAPTAHDEVLKMRWPAAMSSAHLPTTSTPSGHALIHPAKPEDAAHMQRYGPQMPLK